MAKYLDTPEEWDRLGLDSHPEMWMGLDSETDGHDVKESSPAHRARIDVFSVGLATGRVAPRGYEVYEGYVLPERALWYEPIRRGLHEGRWVLHNSNHDRHALKRYGIELTRVYDTLEACRLLWPGHFGYGLKKLRGDLLGKSERDGYTDLVTEIVGVTKTGKWRTERIGIRDIGPTHEKWQAKVDYAGEDAVDAPELRSLCLKRAAELAYKLPESPW